MRKYGAFEINGGRLPSRTRPTRSTSMVASETRVTMACGARTASRHLASTCQRHGSVRHGFTTPLEEARVPGPRRSSDWGFARVSADPGLHQEPHPPRAERCRSKNEYPLIPYLPPARRSSIHAFGEQRSGSSEISNTNPVWIATPKTPTRLGRMKHRRPRPHHDPHRLVREQARGSPRASAPASSPAPTTWAGSSWRRRKACPGSTDKWAAAPVADLGETGPGKWSVRRAPADVSTLRKSDDPDCEARLVVATVAFTRT